MVMRSRTVSLVIVFACTFAALLHGSAFAADQWDKEAWKKRLEAARAVEGRILIQYDAQPNYANWGGVTNFFQQNYGVRVPPDMKGSGPTLAALLREQNNTVADVAYYNALVGMEAGERGVHQAYKPVGFEKIPAYCKDPNGLWFCVHQGVMAFVVNTEALKKANAPIPKCFKDLLDPRLKGLVAYDDPTVHGTAMEAIFAANLAMGGSTSDYKPGIEYLKKLDANILRYSRDSSYNPTLRGEIGVWIQADGSGYKMKWEDKGPIEVVIPCEGTVSVPLAMGLVKWSKRPELAKAYLDWLLSPEAQGIWADSFWLPILPEFMSDSAKQRMKPLYGSYDLIKPVSIAEKRKMIGDYRTAWRDQIRRKE
jgi:putative spermidine/putrescine transport system substrate-binding protein